MWTFYEFFAGGGMARMGLGPEWRCAFANDWDAKKAAAYTANWGNADFLFKDVSEVKVSDLPGHADLVWSSFPCQDLSLAGKGAGLSGKRSGVFWPFWSLMEDLATEGRKPKIIAIENVVGLLNSNGGKDFEAICRILNEGGYRFGAVVVNADRFVPQSRPRLFIIAVDELLGVPPELNWIGAQDSWHPRNLQKAHRTLPAALEEKWVWWRFPAPPPRKKQFIDIMETMPETVEWHTPEETNKLLKMMSPIHLQKVERAKEAGHRVVGGIYKRTRKDENGNKVQRAEVRFDQVAGCLRTPGGGSSRQIIMLIEEGEIRTRLLSPREGARLMGLPDAYRLPKRYNEAYHLVGDGVVVPVVAHLREHLFEPLLAKSLRKSTMRQENYWRNTTLSSIRLRRTQA